MSLDSKTNGGSKIIGGRSTETNTKEGELIFMEIGDAMERHTKALTQSNRNDSVRSFLIALLLFFLICSVIVMGNIIIDSTKVNARQLLLFH